MSDDTIRVTIDRYDVEPEALREALREQGHACDLIVRSGEWVVFGPDLDADAVRQAVDQWAADTGATALTDPDEEMRDRLANFPADGSPKELADLLAGTDGGARVPGRLP